MRPLTALHAASVAASASTAPQSNETSSSNVVPSLWDGQCFYPTGDAGFNLEAYLGTWYQVAGTLAPFTAGCKCIHAQYALNVGAPIIIITIPSEQEEAAKLTSIQDNGTVQVNNTCEAEGRPINILGTATPADPGYGANGVFRVQFPGQPAPECPGPNYIVQGMLPLTAFRAV